ncbi:MULTISPECIES: type II toxin-antitoxin system HipA family toxin [unclassified Novosphingobium]|uniref:type II toxin-antitoxin system HipA family toxin n=1 Tax=unclassified Novosphingobium TaxID=2644732 RepID=UPI0025F9436E|nr:MULTISPECIES: type II toxin-antitoxin system HipA family toxin [unclassified Novosphingobium]HQV03740.1 type II toxin-antitoxin system HipA family toxin [Novosphingobium sp.]
MLILQVWLEASMEPVGYLIKGDDGDLSFTYNSQWLADPNSHALSLSLPLGEEPFGDVPVRAWFGNLLHENDQLETTMARYGIERSDIAGLLEHLGADCPGAVSVLGLDRPPVKRPGTLSEDYDPLDEGTLRDIVERLATGKPLPDGMRDPSPVAGVRRKVSLAALPDGRFALPKHRTGAPTTHILKLPDRQTPKEARDEAFLTDLAAKCGFSVGTCVADQISEHEILLINRFDRSIDGDKVYRLHVEDFAQASGLPSDLKYERRGEAGRRFDATTIGKILAATDQPALARNIFMRMTLFNLLLGNNDNHAKNNGLILASGGSVQLAPFYDLTPVLTGGDYTDELAFNVGAAKRFDDITSDDLIAFCADIGIPAAGAKSLLRTAAGELIDQLEELSASFPREMSALDRLFGHTASHFNDILGLDRNLRERDAHVTGGGGWALS